MAVGFWLPLSGTSGGSGGALPLLHVRDEKASGTSGGSSVIGSWLARTLNTVKTNEITGASLASDTITLPAGTFEIDASSPSFGTRRYQTRLYNVTTAAALIYGTPGYGNDGSSGFTSRVRGQFTLSAPYDVRYEYRAERVQATNGLGLASGFGGVEVYAEVLIHQVS